MFYISVKTNIVVSIISCIIVNDQFGQILVNDTVKILLILSSDMHNLMHKIGKQCSNALIYFSTVILFSS